MKVARTDYEKFAATPSGRRLLRQEELIFDTTDALALALEDSGLNKTQLAKNLGKTKAFVTQLLGGGRNLTLRTIADVCYALNCRAHIQIVPLNATERVVRHYAYHSEPRRVELQPLMAGENAQRPFTCTVSYITEPRVRYNISDKTLDETEGGLAA